MSSIGTRKPRAGRDAIRVVIVEDSAVTRRLVGDTLRSAGFEIAGAAADGRRGLELIEEEGPDAVVTDIEMPVMNGHELLRQLKEDPSAPPVIVLSSFVGPGAAACVKALALGAAECVPKPPAGSGMAGARKLLEQELVPKLRELAKPRRQATPVGPTCPLPPVEPVKPQGRSAPVDAVVIGVSAGGPNTLAKFLPQLPRHLPFPVFIVQHMPVHFTALLAQRLDAVSPLSVREAEDGEYVEPGQVYLAPGGRHLTLKRAAKGVCVQLTDDPPDVGCRPSADALFRSASPIYQDRLLALVLTGMGHDGLDGVGHVKRHRGTVLVQDEETSLVWGMPGAVAKANLADAVLPLDHLASELSRRARQRAAVAPVAAT